MIGPTGVQLAEVVHARFDVFDAYCGRAFGGYAASIWGNPYRIGGAFGGDDLLATRAQVIEAYAVWIRKQPALLAQLPTLKGKRLACWCRRAGTPSPPGQPCHVDVLVKLIGELCP